MDVGGDVDFQEHDVDNLNMIGGRKQVSDHWESWREREYNRLYDIKLLHLNSNDDDDDDVGFQEHKDNYLHIVRGKTWANNHNETWRERKQNLINIYNLFL